MTGHSSRFVLFACSSFLLTCQPSTGDERLIRSVREESNTAIAAHDSTLLARCLTSDYNVVTSRNSASTERRTMLERLAIDWQLKPDLLYRRTPTTVEVFAGWRMAGETGIWVGTWTEANGDRIKLSGSYYAKWHRLDGRWMIRAEIFTPLRCEGGDYCSKGPLDAN